VALNRITARLALAAAQPGGRNFTLSVPGALSDRASLLLPPLARR
jgi:hypothetical protein